MPSNQYFIMVILLTWRSMCSHYLITLRPGLLQVGQFLVLKVVSTFLYVYQGHWTRKQISYLIILWWLMYKLLQTVMTEVVWSLTLQCWGYSVQSAKKQDVWKPSKPCHVGIHWRALCLWLSTLRWVPLCQGFSHFSGFLHHFVFVKISHQQHKG